MFSSPGYSVVHSPRGDKVFVSGLQPLILPTGREKAVRTPAASYNPAVRQKRQPGHNLKRLEKKSSGLYDHFITITH
jgi:hypothetical protein